MSVNLVSKNGGHKDNCKFITSTHPVEECDCGKWDRRKKLVKDNA